MGAQDIGTLVHDVAHELGDTDAATYAAEVEARWGRLGLAPGWLSRRSLAQATAMTDRLARYVTESDAAGWRRAASEARIEAAMLALPANCLPCFRPFDMPVELCYATPRSRQRRRRVPVRHHRPPHARLAHPWERKRS